jgi:hypothetical protein
MPLACLVCWQVQGRGEGLQGCLCVASPCFVPAQGLEGLPVHAIDLPLLLARLAFACNCSNCILGVLTNSAAVALPSQWNAGCRGRHLRIKPAAGAVIPLIAAASAADVSAVRCFPQVC